MTTELNNVKTPAMFDLNHLIASARVRPEKQEDTLALVASLKARMNLPRRHRKLQTFENDLWLDKFHMIKSKLRSGFILALVGTRGTGKTQMAVELIENAVERMVPGRFCLAMDFFLEIKSTYRKESGESEENVIDRFCDPALLVIDETQERGESQWEDRLLTHLINRRYNDLKDTLLISNLTSDEFISAIGSSVASRLNETGGIIECKWDSFRK